MDIIYRIRKKAKKIPLLSLCPFDLGHLEHGFDKKTHGHAARRAHCVLFAALAEAEKEQVIQKWSGEERKASRAFITSWRAANIIPDRQ